MYSIFGLLSVSNQEVVRFNISMNYSTTMDSLDYFDHLNSNMQHCFDVKYPLAFLKQVLKGFTKDLHNHHVACDTILIYVSTNKAQVRYRSFPSQFMDKLRLPEEHDMLLVHNSLLNFGGKKFSCSILL
jgi:mRNA-degrading endonuclease YafQ of YafQ-DinJ toxin-antitoxin module